MTNVVIVSAARTAVGSFNGSFAATPAHELGAAVIEAVETGEFDLLVLDGETSPTGGLGLCRQLKNEIFSCPPVLVLTGRPQDGWLAAWSQADLAVPHPLDPIAVAGAVAELGRRVGALTNASS